MTLVSCGCSFSKDDFAGVPTPSYGRILAEQLGLDFINLAISGASNYFIAKQVEHAITLTPSIVIIGITTPLRYDLVGDKLEFISRRPNYTDFNLVYDSYLPDKIHSKSKHWFKNRNTEIIDMLLNCTNFQIKQDQDLFCILGSCFLLRESNIPFILINFGDEVNEIKLTDRTYYLPYSQLAKRYPLPDSVEQEKLHFNAQGHEFVAKMLRPDVRFQSLR